jgi:hypothetical protein
LVKRGIKYAIVAVVVVFLAIQIVPYGRTASNPPITSEPEWDIKATRDLAVRACFDCHSNETAYPWYSRVAPVSWWTQNHIEEGRDDLNFSEWSWSYDEIDEIAESVMDGEMPPNYYTLIPGDRNLSERERENLIRGLISTFNYSDKALPSKEDSADEDDDDD